MRLEEDTKEYIHINLKQVLITYVNGLEKWTERKMPVGICKEQSFKTDYEKKFYRAYNKD